MSTYIDISYESGFTYFDSMSPCSIGKRISITSHSRFLFFFSYITPLWILSIPLSCDRMAYSILSASKHSTYIIYTIVYLSYCIFLDQELLEGISFVIFYLFPSHYKYLLITCCMSLLSTRDAVEIFTSLT